MLPPLQIRYLLPVGVVSHELLLKHDWADVSRRLTLFVLRRMGQRQNVHDAEEIAQEAVRRFLDPNYAGWDETAEPNLLRHLGSIANGVLSDRRQRSATTREELRAPRELADNRSIDDIERRAAVGELAEQALAALRARLVGDSVGERVFELILQEVDEPREQARHLQVPIREIYNARRRLALHREAIRHSIYNRS